MLGVERIALALEPHQPDLVALQVPHVLPLALLPRARADLVHEPLSRLLTFRGKVGAEFGLELGDRQFFGAHRRSVSGSALTFALLLSSMPPPDVPWLRERAGEQPARLDACERHPRRRLGLTIVSQACRTTVRVVSDGGRLRRLARTLTSSG
jgi:hypothetical protein